MVMWCRRMKTHAHEDFEAILKNLRKFQLNGGSYESHLFEDLEDRIYPKRRHIEELYLINTKKAKENKEICSGQEVSTHVLKVWTHENSIKRID